MAKKPIDPTFDGGGTAADKAVDPPGLMDELDTRYVNPRLVVEHGEKIRVECLKLAAEMRATVTEPASLIMTAQTLEGWVIGDFDRVPETARDMVERFFSPPPADETDGES